MTLRRRSWLDSCCSTKSPRRTGQTINRHTLKQSMKQMTKAAVQLPTAAASGSVLFGAASKANLKVVVRVRPLNAREEESNARNVIEIVDEHMLVFDPKKEEDVFFYHGVKQRRDITKRQHKDQKFVFERVFGPDSTNQDIFESTTKDLIDTLLEGYNCSVFAYGATGAGKTFTMVGRQDCPGITLLTLMELYARIDAMEVQNPGHSVEVAVSYLEVYNETVRDLLQPGKPLQVQESGQQVLVPGLSYHKPRDADHLMQLLAEGNTNRTQHPTDANAESSRSHAVFQVLVKQRDGSSSGVTTSNVSVAKLSMIDLAGSERGSSTGCKGARFREGANINRSLLALGNCINALADGKSHIPYRDSKLTRLLKDSLGGNCRSVMVAAVSMASTTFEDTFNTLRYSNRAKTIKTTLKKNQMSVETHVNQYVKIVETLRQEVTSLKQQLQEGEERERRQAHKYEAAIALLESQLQKYESNGAETASPPEQRSPTNHGAAPPLHSESSCEARALVTVQPLHNTALDPTAPSGPCAARDELLQQLQALSAQASGLLSEWLEVGKYERELQWRLYVARAKAARLNILAFAAYKLNKSIGRLQSTEKTLGDRLRQTQGRRTAVAAKLEAARQQCKEVRVQCQQHVQSHCSSADLLAALSSASQQEELRVQEQEAMLLRTLLHESVDEVRENHRFQYALLHAVRGFHVHLHSSELHTENTKNIFQSVVAELDESRVAWADQKQDDLKGDGAGANNSDIQPVPPDINWLCRLSEVHNPQGEGQPSEGHPGPSPPPVGSVRKSIMKGSSSVLNLQDTHMSPVLVQSIAGTAEELRQSTLANTLSNQRLSILPVFEPPSTPVIAHLVSTAESSVEAFSSRISFTSAPSSTSDGNESSVYINSSSSETKPIGCISNSSSSSQTITTGKNSSCFSSVDDMNDIESPVLSSQSRSPPTSTVSPPPYILQETSPPALPLASSVKNVVSPRETTTSLCKGLTSDSGSNLVSHATANVDTFPPVPSSGTKFSLQRQSGTRNLIGPDVKSSSASEMFSNSLRNVPGSRSGICLSDTFAITPVKDKASIEFSFVPTLNDLRDPALFSSNKGNIKSASRCSGLLNTTVDICSGPLKGSYVERKCTQTLPESSTKTTHLNESVSLSECSTNSPCVTSTSNAEPGSTVNEGCGSRLLNSTFTSNTIADADNESIGDSIKKSALNPASACTESTLNTTYTASLAHSCSVEGSGSSCDEMQQEATSTTRPPARQLVFESPDISSAGESLQNSTFCVQPSSDNSDVLLPSNPLDLLEKSAPAASVLQVEPKPQPKLKGILKNSNSNLNIGGGRKFASLSSHGGRNVVNRSQSVRQLPSGGSSSTLKRNHSSLVKTGASSMQKSYAMRRVMSFKNRRYPNLADNEENVAPSRGAKMPTSVSCSNLSSVGSSALSSASKPSSACWRP